MPMKLSRMVKAGDIIRLKRGLYCVAAQHLRDGSLFQLGVIANRLYGPSYVSFETALGYYGLIPEHVHMQLSAVTKQSKMFKTPLATFRYRQIPQSLFAFGVELIESPNGNYLMANRTKALCDTLLIKRNLRVSSPKNLREFLEVDMRFDFEEFGEPDYETLRGFAACGIKPRLFNALERMFK
ncbi:MAG: hypothetical protein KBT68_01515 [bacterium]|nr:hypothetical protein [Candidatus Colisoma equi]